MLMILELMPNGDIEAKIIAIEVQVILESSTRAVETRTVLSGPTEGAVPWLSCITVRT